MTAEREAMTERQAFEHAFASGDVDHDAHTFRQFHDGSYYDDRVQDKWKGWQAAIDAHLSRAAEPVATNAESKLAEAGVFKGQHGLRGLLGASAFWERQPYGTRLYYGEGIADYLHRDVLDAAVKLLDTRPPEPAKDVTDAMVERGLQAARDASDARLPRYKVVRAILDAAMTQEGE